MGTKAACCQGGAWLVRSNCTAATNKALSASELKNCADMMVKKPRFIEIFWRPLLRRVKGVMCLRTVRGYSTAERCQNRSTEFHHTAMPRPILATIDPAALHHNLNRSRLAAPEAKIWAVVKANAYGHGIERVFEGLRSADGLRCWTWMKRSACAL